MQLFTGSCRKHLMTQPGTDFLLLPTRFRYLQLGFMLAGNCALVCRGLLKTKYWDIRKKGSRKKQTQEEVNAFAAAFLLVWCRRGIEELRRSLYTFPGVQNRRLNTLAILTSSISTRQFHQQQIWSPAILRLILRPGHLATGNLGFNARPGPLRPAQYKLEESTSIVTTSFVVPLKKMFTHQSGCLRKGVLRKRSNFELCNSIHARI